MISHSGPKKQDFGAGARPSILGDAIDFMRELLEKIERLQEKIEEQQQDTDRAAASLKPLRELNPNEHLARRAVPCSVRPAPIACFIVPLLLHSPALVLSPGRYCGMVAQVVRRLGPRLPPWLPTLDAAIARTPPWPQFPSTAGARLPAYCP